MKKTLLLLAVSLFALDAAFAGSLTLTAPNGGELCLGRNIAITWTASGLGAGARVKLILFKDGERVGLIAEDLEAGGSPYPWEVGRHARGTATAGGGYSVCLRTMDNAVEDCDNASFTIKECSGRYFPYIKRPPITPLPLSRTTVQVTWPNFRNREPFFIGERQEVRWTFTHARPDQRLTVFLIRYPAGCRSADSREEINLGSVPIESGSFDWDISSAIQPCDYCTIRLSPQVAWDFAADESDECFILMRRPVVRLLTPNGGAWFSRGSPINITWEADHLLPNQRIQIALVSYDLACGAASSRLQLAKLPIESREYIWPGSTSVPAGRFKIAVAILKSERFDSGHWAEDQSDDCFVYR